jgi:hypothetical protein
MSRKAIAPALHVVAAEPTLGESLSGLWCDETERSVLGAAMLGEPMPAWLESRHFFPTQHRVIFEAVQSVGGNVARVNAWLRESSPKFGPPVAKSHELAEMCLEAEHARRMGWALDFDKLRELWRVRELMACMTRQAILLRHGQATHADCYQALREHFKSCK